MGTNWKLLSLLSNIILTLIYKISTTGDNPNIIMDFVEDTWSLLLCYVPWSSDPSCWLFLGSLLPMFLFYFYAIRSHANSSRITWFCVAILLVRLILSIPAIWIRFNYLHKQGRWASGNADELVEIERPRKGETGHIYEWIIKL